jgi:hypothetical protein
VLAKVLTDASGQTGVYYDEGGHPMLPSTLARDPKFTDRVVAETRALLSAAPTNQTQKERPRVIHQASTPAVPGRGAGFS